MVAMRHDTIIADCAIGDKATSWMPRKGRGSVRDVCPLSFERSEDICAGARVVCQACAEGGRTRAPA